nr:hypothetical protein [Tanacetum cinerariifolium]
AIQEWEPATKVMELRYFLGLVNYYRRFIMGYSAIASPLTDLLKKNQAWIWDEEYQAVFESLKKAVMEEPVLRLPDVTMPFEKEVHGASERDDGGYLLLEDLEALFVSKIVGKDFLAEFDYQLEYKPGKANVVADALSHKAEFAAITQAQFFLQDRIKEGLEHDPLAKKIGDLRRIILKECHDSKWAGHPGIKRTLALVEGTYYWPRMEDDEETFVRTIHGALLDGVIQDHRDGSKLLHEFSSPNRWENREGERTIGALSSALSTRKSPFKLVRQPLTPNALAASYERSSPAAYKTMKPFPGDWTCWKGILSSSTTAQVKDLPVFHVSFLKPYHGDEEDPERAASKRAPTTVVTSYDREVEEILSDRTIHRRGVPSYKDYLIKWHDLTDSEAS